MLDNLFTQSQKRYTTFTPQLYQLAKTIRSLSLYLYQLEKLDWCYVILVNIGVFFYFL